MSYSIASLAPKTSERMVIVGATGTGKTTLARAVLPMYKYVVAIDPICMLGTDGKRGRWLDGYALAKTPGDLARLGKRHERIQYRPNPEYQNWESYDLVYHWLFDRGDTMVYTDEGLRVMRGTRATEWLNACLTAGRQRGIGMITCTQRPTGLDLRVISEAEHKACFRLEMEADRRRMASQMGEVVAEKPARDHNFWYKHVSMDNPKYLYIPRGG